MPAQPNAETLAALQETEDMLAGRIDAPRYASAQELFEALDAEADPP